MVGCGILAFQDIKDREVSWILFPVLSITLTMLHFHNVDWPTLGVSILINIITVSFVVFLLWLITRFVFHKAFLNVSFGLGDLLLFYTLALGFPTVTFIYLFIGAIGFALLAFLPMKLFLKSDTVPLAGLMGIFLMAVLFISFIPSSPSLYSI
jgi:hypothetical protein